MQMMPTMGRGVTLMPQMPQNIPRMPMNPPQMQNKIPMGGMMQPPMGGMIRPQIINPMMIRPPTGSFNFFIS